MNKKNLISIVGPTAIGKTTLAIAIAKHYKTEIISADSRQFYKEMSIGTAVPSHEELASVPHHFIQHKSIFEEYTVGDFEREAIEKLATLFEDNDIVVMVGGSGLYVDAIKDGLDNFPSIDPKIRESLNETLITEGILSLQERLKHLDSDYYGQVDLNNPHRLIRALEVCIGSGLPYTSFLKQKKPDIDLGTAIAEIKKNTRRFAKRQLTWLRKKEDILWIDYNYELNEILEKIEQKRNG